MTFGAFFKEKRIQLGKSLRQFCIEHDLDPGNISKLERDKLPPPTSGEKLRKLASYLKIDAGSSDWEIFKELAFVGAGRIPDDLEKEVIDKLPIFFRALKGKKFSKKELNKLIDRIKKS